MSRSWHSRIRLRLRQTGQVSIVPRRRLDDRFVEFDREFIFFRLRPKPSSICLCRHGVEAVRAIVFACFFGRHLHAVPEFRSARRKPSPQPVRSERMRATMHPAIITIRFIVFPSPEIVWPRTHAS